MWCWYPQLPSQTQLTSLRGACCLEDMPLCGGPTVLGVEGLCRRGFMSSLGVWQWKHQADPTWGYSGPSQESETTESFWGWSLGLKLPQCLSAPRSGHRTKLCLYSFLSCPSLGPPHHGWHLAEGFSAFWESQVLGPRVTVQAGEAVGGPPGVWGL